MLSLAAMPRETASGETSERPPRPTESDDSPSFGEYLRRERLKEQRTLDEESKATGVPAIYLEALEENDFEKLPPTIYVRGYLATFARAHGLSSHELRERFESAFREHRRVREEASASIFGLFSPPGEKFQWRDWSVPIGLALALLAFSLVSQYLPGEVQETGTAGEESPPPPREEARSPQLRAAAPANAAFEEAPVRVMLRAEEVTRVSIAIDGGGTDEWSLQAGETRYLAAEGEIVLTLGNAGAVRLNYNGRELGFIGDKGEVKRAVRFVAEKKE